MRVENSQSNNFVNLFFINIDLYNFVNISNIEKYLYPILQNYLPYQ